MRQTLTATIIFVVFEIVAIVAFYITRKYFAAKGEKSLEIAGNVRLSIIKGILERLVIYMALIYNAATVLVMFGALKIATRLDSKTKISNDYFLVGNFLSALIAIIAFAVYQQVKSTCL